MGRLVRCISSDGSVVIMAADTTDIVRRAEQIHKTSAVISAALGRALSAASLMGSMLKGADDSLTLRINGSGPSGTIMAVSDSEGNVRGYAANPVVELPLNSKGKLDVGGAIGTDGTLTVIKDLGLRDPYVGQIPIVTGEIAEDITSYYAVSEQIASVCSLGVLVNPDLTIANAGGFIIQLLPGASDDIITLVEESIKDIPSVTAMLSDNLTPIEICKRALGRFELDILDESQPEYRCSCSSKRVESALIAAGKDELLKIAEDEITSVTCNFCDAVYNFSSDEIKALIN